MEQLYEIIQANVHYAPYIIFGAMLLAGLNLPVSEDGMLFISAVLAAKYPDLSARLYLGIFAGAYCSDIICYWLGRLLGPNLWKVKWFAKMVSKNKIRSIHRYYQKYGPITLIVGRFVPFGVRNALFLTAGLGKMHFFKFSVSDLFACIISTSVFFSLYYHFGEKILVTLKKGNIILLSTLFLLLISYFLYSKFYTGRKAAIEKKTE